MGKKKIYLDYDGTLVDFIGGLFSYMDEPIVEKLENRHYEVVRNGEYYKEHVQPFEYALQFLETLNETFEVIIITSSIGSGQKTHKFDHIKRHFPEKYTEIIPARSKHKHTHDGVFVDDDIRKVYDHCIKNNTLGILMNLNGGNKLDEDKLGELESMYGEAGTEQAGKFLHAKSFDDILGKLGLVKIDQKNEQKKEEKKIAVKKNSTASNQR